MPEVVHASEALLGEGPVWHAAAQRLYWVDIKAPRIWSWCSRTHQATQWTPPWRIGALAPRSGGGFVAATEHGFALIDPAADRYELIGNPEPELPGNRFNDGKVAPDGSFWAGTMDDAEKEATGSLYRLAPSRAWTRIDSGYRVSNGPAFSPDGSVVYHSDSARREVYRFALGPEGTVGERQSFLRFDEADGYPDGMTTDRHGCLWIAFWDGNCLRRFSPDGATLAQVDMPVRRPTSCAFGGADLDQLFVTSARVGLGRDALSEQPLAGALFMLRAGSRGFETPVFAG